MVVPPDPRPAPLFVGDHLALDFVNTTAAPSGVAIEWLANGKDILAWLERAGAIDHRVAAMFRAEADALDAVAEGARDIRAWLRDLVERHAGKPLSARALDELEPLNHLLARDEIYHQIAAAPHTSEQTLIWAEKRRWTAATNLLQPIAEAIGDLICHADFRLIRTCEGPSCTLMFYDRTKGHARRWCSMSVCGNRAKATAHRARLRAAKKAAS